MLQLNSGDEEDRDVTDQVEEVQNEKRRKVGWWSVALGIGALAAGIAVIAATSSLVKTHSSSLEDAENDHNSQSAVQHGHDEIDGDIHSMVPSAAPSNYPTVSSSPTIGSTEAVSALPTELEFGFESSPSYHVGSNAVSPSTAPAFMISTFLPTGLASVVTNVTYVPGDLVVQENGLLLSRGLKSRIIGRVSNTVQYDAESPLYDSDGGMHSTLKLQQFPDFGATFWDSRDDNAGGWIYAFNHEIKDSNNRASVGALTFSKDNALVDYRLVLEGTRANCGGGRVPWGAWISCEEYPGGNIWQVDPTGERPGQRITLGRDGGLFESFTYDVRDSYVPRFFVSEDRDTGPVRRFTPDEVNWNEPWSILTGSGTTDYLLLTPDRGFASGTFEWTSNKKQAGVATAKYAPNCEGIDAVDGKLFFVCKVMKILIALDLDNGTYTNSSTVSGLFDGAPDQVEHILGDDQQLLYFTEEGSGRAGIHGRNRLGQFFTILESVSYRNDETTGLAFSPDGRTLLFSFQNNGVMFAVERQDGLPFQDRTLNIKYHATS